MNVVLGLALDIASSLIAGAAVAVWLRPGLPRVLAWTSALVAIAGDLALASLGHRVALALAIAAAGCLAAWRLGERVAEAMATLSCLVAAILAPPIGIASAAALWWRRPTEPWIDVGRVVLGIVIIILPGAPTWDLRLVVIITVAAAGLALRGPVQRRPARAGARTAAAWLAVATPAASVAALLFFDTSMIANDTWGALTAGVVAVLVGCVGSVVLLGSSLLMTTRNELRGPVIGLVCAVILGAGLTGPAAAAWLVPYASLTIGIVAARVVRHRKREREGPGPTDPPIKYPLQPTYRPSGRSEAARRTSK